LLRGLPLGFVRGDLGLKFGRECEEDASKPGLMGDVAVGIKNGSTIGFVIAVCRDVKTRRGPAGLGITIISGNLIEGEPLGARIDCKTPLIDLKLDRLVKWTITPGCLFNDEGVAVEHPRPIARLTCGDERGSMMRS